MKVKISIEDSSFVIHFSSSIQRNYFQLNMENYSQVIGNNIPPEIESEPEEQYSLIFPVDSGTRAGLDETHRSKEIIGNIKDEPERHYVVIIPEAPEAPEVNLKTNRKKVSGEKIFKRDFCDLEFFCIRDISKDQAGSAANALMSRSRKYISENIIRFILKILL